MSRICVIFLLGKSTKSENWKNWTTPFPPDSRGFLMAQINRKYVGHATTKVAAASSGTVRPKKTLQTYSDSAKQRGTSSATTTLKAKEKEEENTENESESRKQLSKISFPFMQVRNNSLCCTFLWGHRCKSKCRQLSRLNELIFLLQLFLFYWRKTLAAFYKYKKTSVKLKKS